MLDTHCRVCGFNQDAPPWDENGAPSWYICDCCGTHFGYGDTILKAVRSNRQKWLDNGAQWFSPEEKPENWNLEEQLKNIPPEWV